MGDTFWLYPPMLVLVILMVLGVEPWQRLASKIFNRNTEDK